MNEREQANLGRLLIYRALIAGLILIIAVYFYFQPIPALQRQVLLFVSASFIFFMLPEFWLSKTRLALPYKLAFQFFPDLLLVSGLVFATGGQASPFAFIYGLIVVVAGSLAHPLFVQVVGLTSCICYLAAVHLYSWRFGIFVTTDQTLHILLQTLALLLVTGVVAAMARRRQQLVSESSQVRRQHQNLQELLARVTESMQEGLLVLDEDMKVQDANEAAKKLLHFSGDIQGRKLDELIHLPAGLKDFVASASRDVYREEWNDKGHTWLITMNRLPEDHRGVPMWLMQIANISELRELQRRLAEKDKLATLGRMAAHLAHEIRNPLQTIGQAMELMPVGTTSQDREIREIVMSEIRRLNRLVSDMLDFSSPLQPQPSRVHLPAIIHSAIQQVDMKGRHHIRSTCELENVNIDIDHFRLVIDNLLSNAVHASPEPGSVRVGFRACGERRWLLEVEDQGRGIPREIRHRLFEPFVTGHQGGFGLGLATVQQVCKTNGWEITVQSLEHGTLFQVIGRQA
jgi:signal transduction histidine kinase